MTTNPKRPRQSFKSTQWRELRLLRYFPERIHLGEWYSGNSLRKEGKTIRKLFWEECCSNLFITACWLGELTDKFWINTEFEDWYMSIAAPSSSQGDQSKLGGSEKSLSERSPGVGREERPPIVVVVPVWIGSVTYLFMLNEYEWMHVIFILYDWRVS